MLTPAPIYQSLTRPLQVSGAEREYAIVVIGGTLLLAIIGYYFWSLYCAIAAPIYYTGGMLFLRRAAKRDPQLIAITQRYYSYKAFYPARTDPTQHSAAVLIGAALVMAGLVMGYVAYLRISPLWGLASLVCLLLGGFLAAKDR